jgi:hypothetical protein
MANEQNLKPFLPGQSGNPAGKPKGARSMKTMLREFLENIVIETPKDGFIENWATENKISAKELLVLDDIKDALYGDAEAKDKSKKRIWEYTERKPDQHQTLEIKQPQTKEEMTAEIAKYAKNNGLTIQEYCDREGIDIDTLGNDVKLLDGNV